MGGNVQQNRPAPALLAIVIIGLAFLAAPLAMAQATSRQAPAAQAAASPTDGASEAAAGLAYARQFAAAHSAPLPTSVSVETPLKAQASPSSPTVNTVPAGTVLLVYGCQSPGWCEVAYGNAQFGWVAMAAMDPTQSRENLQYWQSQHK